jgi:hypothetical protein
VIDDQYKVSLNEPEMLQVALAGICRRITHLFGRVKNKNVHPSKDNWDNDIESAAAECAGAKWLHAYWGGPVNNFKECDMDGRKIQVRGTKYIDGHLTLRTWDDENKDKPFLLVVGTAPTFWLAGWMYGHEAMKDEYWTSDYGGQWQIEQIDLKDPYLLYELDKSNTKEPVPDMQPF